MTITATATFVEAAVPGLSPVRAAYERRGSGEPLVLLHGIGHHRQAWEPVLDLLAEDREVIAFDLPGFGESAIDPSSVPHDLEDVTAVFAAIFQALDIERPHVAGNSLGGLIALHLGRAGHARTVTALSPGGFWSEPERVYAFTLLSAMRRGARLLPPATVERLSRTAAGRAALTGTIYARPGRRAPEAVVAETRALREATGFEATLAAGRDGALFSGGIADDVPVTIAWGSRDRVLLPRQGVRAKRVVPHAQLVRLPGCGHVPMNDDPRLVARVILDATA